MSANEKERRGPKAERREATRAALVAAARELFAERGYAAVGTEEVVQRAGVTRRALYHHFADKGALFRAVFEQVEEELVARAAAAASDAPPAKRLEAAVGAFLDACLDRDVQQIVLQDGFSVLGFETASQIDEAYALGSIQALLELAISEGQIAEQPVEPLAQILFGALNQAALVIARAEDVPAARAAMGGTIARLLAALA